MLSRIIKSFCKKNISRLVLKLILCQMANDKIYGRIDGEGKFIGY